MIINDLSPSEMISFTHAIVVSAYADESGSLGSADADERGSLGRECTSDSALTCVVIVDRHENSRRSSLTEAMGDH